MSLVVGIVLRASIIADGLESSLLDLHKANILRTYNVLVNVMSTKESRIGQTFTDESLCLLSSNQI